MNIQQFNNQGLLEKERYINSFVSGKPFITGALIFEKYKLITIYSLSGQLLSCEASTNNEHEEEEAKELLQGRICLAVDLSNFPGINAAISNKLMKAGGQLN